MPRFRSVIIDADGSLQIEAGANVDVDADLSLNGIVRVTSEAQLTSGGQLKVLNGSIEVTGASANINVHGSGSLAGHIHLSDDGDILLYDDSHLSLFENSYISLDNGTKIQLNPGVDAAVIDFQGSADSQLSGQLIGHPYVPVSSSMRFDGALYLRGAITLAHDVSVSAAADLTYTSNKSFQRSIDLTPIYSSGSWTFTWSNSVGANCGRWVPLLNTVQNLFVVEVSMPLAAKSIDRVVLRYDGHVVGEWVNNPPASNGCLNVVIVDDSTGHVSRSSPVVDTGYTGVREITEDFGGTPLAFNAVNQRLFIEAITPYFAVSGTGFFDLLKLEVQFGYDVIQPG